MLWLQRICLNLIQIVLLSICVTEADEWSPWRWSCEDMKCVKTFNNPQNSDPVLSLEACKMFCHEFGLLWPRPTGYADLGNLTRFNFNNIEIIIVNEGRANNLLKAAGERFKSLVTQAVPKGILPIATGKSILIYLINNNPDVKEFSLDMDESYSIKVAAASNDQINANITGNTFFGVRHGLESLSQLIVYDDIKNHLLIVRDAIITDKPVYPYRGIMLDTARNYYPIESIKRTIDVMGTMKLNTFHWHIIDSQSFPFESERKPNLTKFGALSPSKIYTKNNIRDIVQYALERGVRVLPEFDAPAHVGEGWQGTDLTVCFKEKKWKLFCSEPPCGQLNPTKEKLYDHLEEIYRDMADCFETDLFHMGGDEVNAECWNSIPEIQQFMIQNRWGVSKLSFLKLWGYFQAKAQDRAYKAFGKKLPIILWSSTLTDYAYVDKFINKDDYIIQAWTSGSDPQIEGLLSKGFKLILSNYDALYLDCGFGAWTGSGHNWCSPYKSWQKVFDNSPANIAGQYKDQILGGEATLWSEQADSATLDSRLWPRAAALAERLWAEPAATWRDVEHRMLHTRERLVRMGIQAESIQPEWCNQNEGYCLSNSISTLSPCDVVLYTLAFLLLPLLNVVIIK